MRSSPYYGVTRYLLLLCASILTLGAFQSASAQNLVTFSIGSRSYDPGTQVYSADLVLTVQGSGGVPDWQIGRNQNIRFTVNGSAMTGAAAPSVSVTSGSVLNTPSLSTSLSVVAPGVYNLTWTTTGAVGLPFVVNPVSGVTVATIRWTVPVASSGLLDNILFVTDNTLTTIYTNQFGNIAQTFNSGTNTGFGVTQPTPQVIQMPSITFGPVALPLCEQSTTTLSVTAAPTGGSFTYQWGRSTDGGATFTDISGATSSTFTTLATMAQNGNRFRVTVVSSGNPVAFVTSASTTLTVNQFPTANSLTLTPSVATSSDAPTTNLNIVVGGNTTGSQYNYNFLASSTFGNLTVNPVAPTITNSTGNPTTAGITVTYTGFATNAQVTVTLASITSTATGCVTTSGITTSATVLPLGPALSATSANVCFGQTNTLLLTLGQQGGGTRSVTITTTAGVVVTAATAGIASGTGSTNAVINQATASTNTITLFINGTVLSTGSYVMPITITDAAGRSTSANLTVNVIALPAGTVTVTGATAVLPNGSLYVTSGTQITLNTVTTTNVSQYRYTVLGTPTTGVSATSVPTAFIASTQQTVTVSYTGVATNATITFQVEGTTASGCVAVIGTTTITVVPPSPTVTFAQAAVNDCDSFTLTVGVSASENSRLGANTTGTVLAPYAASTGAGVTITPGSTTFGNTNYAVTFATVNNTTRVYELTVTDAIGRVTTASLNITVYPRPAISSVSINGTPASTATVTSVSVATDPTNLTFEVNGANTANLEYRWRVTATGSPAETLVPTTANSAFFNLHTNNANFQTFNSTLTGASALRAVNVATTSHTLTYTLDARNATTGCVVLGVTTLTVRVLPPAPVVTLNAAPNSVCDVDGITQQVTITGGATTGTALAYSFGTTSTVSTGTFTLQNGTVNVAGPTITLQQVAVTVTVPASALTGISGAQTFTFATIDAHGRVGSANKAITVTVTPTIVSASILSTFGNTTSAGAFTSGHPITLGVTGANHVAGINYTWRQVTTTSAGVVALTVSPQLIVSSTQLTITPINNTNAPVTVVIEVTAANAQCSRTTTFSVTINPPTPVITVLDTRSDNTQTSTACSNKPIYVRVQISSGTRPLTLAFSTNAGTSFVDGTYPGLSFATTGTFPVAPAFSTNETGLSFGNNITINDPNTTVAIVRIQGTAGFLPSGTNAFQIRVTEANVPNRSSTAITTITLEQPLVTSATRLQFSNNGGATFTDVPASMTVTTGDVVVYRVTNAGVAVTERRIQANSGYDAWPLGISSPFGQAAGFTQANVSAVNPTILINAAPSTRAGIGTGVATIQYVSTVVNASSFCEEVVTNFSLTVLPKAPQILALTPSNVTTCSGSATETVFITVTNGSFTTTTALLNAISVTAPGAVATYTNVGTQFFTPGTFGFDNTTAVIQIQLNTFTTGTYSFTLTDQFGRSTSSNIQININALPTITSLTVNGVANPSTNVVVTNGNVVPVVYAASTTNNVQATWNVVAGINPTAVSFTFGAGQNPAIFQGNTGTTLNISVVNNTITMATVNATLASLLNLGTGCVTLNATTFTMTVLPTAPALVSQSTTLASTCATPTSSTTASFVFSAGAYRDLTNTARTDAQFVSITGPGATGVATSAVTINGNNASFNVTFNETATEGLYTVTITDWANRTTSATVNYQRNPLPVITGASIAVNAPNTVVIVPANATTLTVRVTSGTVVTFGVVGLNLTGSTYGWTTTAQAGLTLAGFPGASTTTNPMNLTFTNPTNTILNSVFTLNSVVTPFGCVTTANPALVVTFEVYPPAPQITGVVNNYTYLGVGPTWETVGSVTNAICENNYLRFNYSVTGGLGATMNYAFNGTTNLTPLTRDETDITNTSDDYVNPALSQPRAYRFTGTVPTISATRNLIYYYNVGATSGTYTITVTEGAPLFRTTSATFPITVNPLPVANQAFVRAGGVVTYTAGTTLSVTSGQANATGVSIYATGANISAYGFQWILVTNNNATTSFAGHGAFGGAVANQFITTNVANNSQSLGRVTYRLNLINFTTGCVSPNSTTVTINVHPALPTLTLSAANATICHPTNGGTAATFTITVSGGLVNGTDDILTIAPVGASSVAQSVTRTGNNSVWTASVLANATTTYNLTFVDSLGRQATATFTLNVLPSLGTAAPLTINGTPATSTAVTTGTQVVLASSPVQTGFEYRWIRTQIGTNVTAPASTDFIGPNAGNTLTFNPTNSGTAVETVTYELQVRNALCLNPVTVSTAVITVYPAVPTIVVSPASRSVLHPNQGGGVSNFVATASNGVWAGATFTVTPATGITQTSSAANVNSITVAPNAHMLNVASTATYTVTFTDGIGRTAQATFTVTTQPDVTSASTFTINGAAVTRALFNSGSLVTLRATPRIPNLEYRWVRWSQTVGAPQFVVTDSQAGWDTVQNEFPINVANNTNSVQTAVYRLLVRQNGNTTDTSVVFEATIDVLPAAPVVTLSAVQDTVCHPNQGGGVVNFVATVATGLRPGTWTVTPAVGTITTATLNANQVEVSITGIAANQTYTVTFTENTTSLVTTGTIRSASANFNVVVRPNVLTSGQISVNGVVGNAITVTSGTAAATGIQLSFPQQPSFEYRWVLVQQSNATGTAVPTGFAPANNQVSVNVANSTNVVGTVQYRLEVQSTDCPAVSTVGTVTITVNPVAPTVALSVAADTVCHPNNGGVGTQITATATGGVWAGASFAVTPNTGVTVNTAGNVATINFAATAAAGTYTVTFTDGLNRTATQNFTLVVLPELTAGQITVNGVVSNAITVTSGTAAANAIALGIPATTGFTYKWTVVSSSNASAVNTPPAAFGTNNNNFSANVANNTNAVGTVVYRLEASNTNCPAEFVVGQVTVTVNPAVPALVLSQNADTVCAPANGGNGTTISATVTGGVWAGASFAVTPNTGVTVQATAQPNVVNIVFSSAANSGNYTVTFTDGLGRTSSQTFALTVLPVLNAGQITVNGVATNAIAVTSGTAAASGIALAVPANANYSYKWSVVSSANATAVNTPANTFAPNNNSFNANVVNNTNAVGTIIYRLEAQGLACPTDFVVGQVTVTVYPVVPTLAINPTADTVCHPSNGGNGTTVVATATGGVWTGANFTVTPNTGVTVQATAQPNVVNVVFSTTAAAGNYTITFTEGAPLNRAASQQFTLTILPAITGSVTIAQEAGNVVNGNNVAVTSGTAAADDINVSVTPAVVGFEYRWVRVTPLPFGVTDNTPAGVSNYGSGNANANFGLANASRTTATITYRLDIQNGSAGCTREDAARFTVTLYPQAPTLVLSKVADTVCAPTLGGGISTFTVTLNTGIKGGALVATPVAPVVNVIATSDSTWTVAVQSNSNQNVTLTYTEPSAPARSVNANYSYAVVPGVNMTSVATHNVTTGTAAASNIALTAQQVAGFEYRWVVASNPSNVALTFSPANANDWSNANHTASVAVANNSNAVANVVVRLETRRVVAPLCLNTNNGNVTITVNPAVPTLATNPAADTICNGAVTATEVVITAGAYVQGNRAAMFTVTPANAGITFANSPLSANTVLVGIAGTVPAGTYTFRFTDDLGRVATSTYTLTRIVAPVVAAGQDFIRVTTGSINNVTLNATAQPNTVYKWTALGGVPSYLTYNFGTQNIATYAGVNQIATGTFVNNTTFVDTVRFALGVLNTQFNCETDPSDTVTVVILPPTPSLALSTTAAQSCNVVNGGTGVQFSMTVNGGAYNNGITAGQFAISNGAFTVTPTIQGANTAAVSLPITAPVGNYTITYTDLEGRQATATFTYTILPALVAPALSVPNSNVCIVNGTGTTTVSNGTAVNPTSTYTWAVTPNAGVTVSNNTGAGSTVAFTVPGIYTIRLTETTNFGCVTSSTIQVDVRQAPVVSAVTPAIAVREFGQTQTFSVTLTAPVATYNVVWESKKITGATWSVVNTSTVNAGGVLNLDVLTNFASDSTEYRVTVTNTLCGSTVVSNTGRLFLDRTAAPNIFINIVQGQRVCVGQTIALEVSATSGTVAGPGMTFEWYRNGQLVATTTQPLYQVNAATVADAGQYRVEAVNVLGTRSTSNTVGIVVDALPAFATPALTISQNVCVGQSATVFANVASTSGPIAKYVLKRGTTVVAEQVNNPLFVLQNVTLASAGTYTVELVPAGACSNNPVVAASAALTVVDTVAITAQPVNAVVCQNNAVTFTVAATGAASFQWQRSFDGIVWTNIVGANAASYTINNVAFADEADYRVIVSAANNCGTKVSAVAELEVATNPGNLAITTQPISQTVCRGETVVFSVATAGVNPVAVNEGLVQYRWIRTRNGVETVVGTGTSLVIANADSVNIASYRVEVSASNVCGTQRVTSNTVALNLKPAVRITVQPRPTEACENQGSLELSVQVVGETLPGGLYSYQWYFNDQIALRDTVIGNLRIRGANGQVLTIENPGTFLTGNYKVVVRGGCATDSAVSVTVPVVINTATRVSLVGNTRVTARRNQTVSFRTDVNAKNPVFQWFRLNENGTVDTLRDNGIIQGARTGVLTINGVQESDTTGNNVGYFVVVSGACGVDTASYATLKIPSGTIDADDIADATACVGSDARFTVSATTTVSNGILRYQWYRIAANGTPEIINGATDTAYVARNAGTAPNVNGTKFFVIVTELLSGGTFTTNEATLNVITEPEIATQPENVVACEDEVVGFAVVATPSSGVVRYQWFRNGTALANQTAQALAFPNGVTAADAGTYSVRITNDCGNVTSDEVTLTVRAATVITQQPQDVQVDRGAQFTLTVAATGEGTLTYQWFKNGQPINGATANSFTVSPTADADGGQYFVVVTGACGPDTSRIVAVVIRPVSADDASVTGLTLEQNYPNPFSSVTTVRFSVPKTTHVKLAIRDISGREIITLVNEVMNAGSHAVEIDANKAVNGTNLSSGMYLYTLTVDGKTITKQMILRK